MRYSAFNGNLLVITASIKIHSTTDLYHLLTVIEILKLSFSQIIKHLKESSLNRIYGNYNVWGDKIKVTRIGGTRAGYGLDMIVYTRALQNLNKYIIKDDTLSLYSAVLKQDLLHIKSNRQSTDSVKIRIDLVTKPVIEKAE